MNDNEEEMMALYAVIKRELEAIEALRSSVDSSISRLESLSATIANEVYRESIQGIHSVLNAVKNDFKTVIEQQGISTTEQLERTKASLIQASERATTDLRSLKAVVIIGFLMLGMLGGIAITGAWFHYRFDMVESSVDRMTQAVEGCVKPAQAIVKKRHR